MSAILVTLRLLILVLELSYYYFDRIFHRLFTKKKDLNKQVVLITGAGSGIGRILSEKLVKLGCFVIGWDINEEGLKETARLVETAREPTNDNPEILEGAFRHFVVDITNRDLVYETASKIKEPVDIIINNAGVVSGSHFLLDIPDEKIVKTFEVNSLSHFWIVKAFLGEMLERNHGHIVTISSMAGIHGGSKLSDYSASKFAAVGFDDSLRWELRAMGKSGVHTTVVCPWVINTGMFEGAGHNQVPFLLPILEPVDVADRIIRGIQLNETHIYMPPFIQAIQILRLMFPMKFYDQAAAIMGLDHSLDHIQTRQDSS
jgi:all-trans-retinol dehydrogenase (NAD+)